MTERFQAGNTTLGDFTDDVLAECLMCGGCVHVVPVGDAHRAACPACGWSRGSNGPMTSWGTAHDPWLGLLLWLRTPVAGETLWAFNEAHLAVLEAYVRADLRERGDYDRRLPRPMVDKLPAWLKSAKHRDEVLAGIARLRKRLAEA